jgi:hypothetical protein
MRIYCDTNKVSAFFLNSVFIVAFIVNFEEARVLPTRDLCRPWLFHFQTKAAADPVHDTNEISFS